MFSNIVFGLFILYAEARYSVRTGLAWQIAVTFVVFYHVSV